MCFNFNGSQILKSKISKHLWAGEVHEPRKCHGSSERLVAEAHQGPVLLADKEGLDILDSLADDDEGVVQEGGQQQDVPWLQSVAVLGGQVTNHHYKVVQARKAYLHWNLAFSII